MKLLYAKIILLLMISACLGQSAPNTDSGQKNALDAILNSFEKLNQVNFLTAETLHKRNDEPEKTKTVVKFIAPASSQTTMFYEEVKITETISVGKESFSFFDGVWEKSTENFEEAIKCVQQFIDSPAFIKNSQFTGVEEINGAATEIYQYDFDSKAFMQKLNERYKSSLPADNDEIKIKLWINKEGLPVKREFVRKIFTAKGKLYETLVKTTTYDYGENIKIEVPKI